MIRTLVVLSLAGGGSALTLAAAHRPFASAASPSTLAADSVVSPFELREIEIAFYSDRARRDPLGAADRARVASLYLDRSRETGSFDDLTRAESYARESVALRTAHNAQTFTLLASILMAQHRFIESLRAAERADAQEPGSASHRSLIAEVAMELGRYDRARAVFDSLRREPLDAASILRLARWDELTGHPERAEEEVRRVLDSAVRSPGTRPTTIAWLRLRIADIMMRAGRLAAADSQLQAGLAAAPDDHRLLAAHARLAATRGLFRLAIASGEKSLAVTLDPGTLGVLSDAWAALGDSAQAESYARTMGTVALSQPAAGGGPPHRAWSLFLLDHGRDVPQVLRLVRADLKVRKDIYGYDVYAWALHKSGRHREAWVAMQQALALGTRDPVLARHAAAIKASL